MRVVIQRCSSSSVIINNLKEEKIGNGLTIFLGICNGDTEDDINYLINKIVNLRIFEDDFNKMNYSVKDINGEILLISQFTLYADTRKGNRPSFEKTMNHIEANKLYDKFVKELSFTGISYKTGEFRSDMKVNIINDGPVTIIIDSKEK